MSELLKASPTSNASLGTLPIREAPTFSCGPSLPKLAQYAEIQGEEGLMDYSNRALLQLVPKDAKRVIQRAKRRRQLKNHCSDTAYDCPVCGYSGSFLPTGGEPSRHAAQCPECGSVERHRLQSLVLDRLLCKASLSSGSILHFAPEAAIGQMLAEHFDRYETADLFDKSQTHVVDISSMQFEDESFDCVYASHVLEHVKDDARALAEVYRVLRPGGFAVLPVPVVCDPTLEYPEPSPTEHFHVRAPGVDYFDRYRSAFDVVEVFHSEQFDQRFQLFAIEDRTGFPTTAAPWRPPQSGERHSEHVPVCWKSA